MRFPKDRLNGRCSFHCPAQQLQIAGWARSNQRYWLPGSSRRSSALIGNIAAEKVTTILLSEGSWASSRRSGGRVLPEDWPPCAPQPPLRGTGPAPWAPPPTTVPDDRPATGGSGGTTSVSGPGMAAGKLRGGLWGDWRGWSWTRRSPTLLRSGLRVGPACVLRSSPLLRSAPAGRDSTVPSGEPRRSTAPQRHRALVPAMASTAWPDLPQAGQVNGIGMNGASWYGIGGTRSFRMPRTGDPAYGTLENGSGGTPDAPARFRTFFGNSIPRRAPTRHGADLRRAFLRGERNRATRSCRRFPATPRPRGATNTRIRAGRGDSGRSSDESSVMWIAGEPVTAKPPGMLVRALRWTRRNRFTARIALGATAALVVGCQSCRGVGQSHARRTGVPAGLRCADHELRLRQEVRGRAIGRGLHGGVRQPRSGHARGSFAASALRVPAGNHGACVKGHPI